MAPRVLILGGTSDARRLAECLTACGYGITTSLAGVTRDPVLPAGKIRLGGFGGAAGLAAYLQAERIDALIDATHPFAARIAVHAHAAAAETSMPLLRLERAAWEPETADRWIGVPDIDAAAAALPPGARVLLTIGRKEIAPFLARGDLSGIVRSIEEPGAIVPQGWTLRLERPPFAIEGERRLMEDARITHLVTKNAGGEETRAKLIAARALGLPAIMIARPRKPEAATVSRIEDAEAWLATVSPPPRS